MEIHIEGDNDVDFNLDPRSPYEQKPDVDSKAFEKNLFSLMIQFLKQQCSVLDKLKISGSKIGN